MPGNPLDGRSRWWSTRADTHKIAISNHRIRNVDEQCKVTFDYKDYADSGIKKIMTLQGEEFLRRFAQHNLPKGFCKILSAGIYSNHGRLTRMETIQKKMQMPLHAKPVVVPWHIRCIERTGINPLVCPYCKKGTTHVLEIVKPLIGVIKKPPPE